VQPRLSQTYLVEGGGQNACRYRRCIAGKNHPYSRFKKCISKFTLQIVIIALVTLSSSAFSVVADDYSDRRIHAGAKLFRTLLAADQNITEKISPDNNLQLGLIYENNQSVAKSVADDLQHRANSDIRNIPIKTRLLKVSELASSGAAHLAGLFITQQLFEDELQMVLRYAVDHQIIIYSPFEGDVEKGVLGGMSVEARVRPYLNIKTMQAANVHLKPFFMKVAKQYE